MSFQAANNYVFLLLDDKGEKVTSGGVIIPDNKWRKPPDEGRIVAAGPGKFGDNGEWRPNPFKEGQVVIFEKPHARGIIIDEVEYVCLDADHVIAVREDT